MDNTTMALETVIDTMHDSFEGYRKAAAVAQTPALRRVLENQAARRRRSLDMLNRELARSGGKPMEQGNAAGKLHHLWLDLTALFENGDEAAIGRVEEGEDYLVGKIDEALASGTLDPATRTIVEQVRREVREGERLADQLDRQLG